MACLGMFTNFLPVNTKHSFIFCMAILYIDCSKKYRRSVAKSSEVDRELNIRVDKPPSFFPLEFTCLAVFRMGSVFTNKPEKIKNKLSCTFSVDSYSSESSKLRRLNNKKKKEKKAMFYK